MNPHGKQTSRNWPESSVAELVEMIDRLQIYCRVDGVHEIEGELEDWRAAKAILARYKPVLTQTSSQAF
jgi:hypothetical protein